MAVFSIHSLTNHPKGTALKLCTPLYITNHPKDLADHLVITPQAYKSPHFAYKAFPKVVVVVLVSTKPTVEYKRDRVFQVKSSCQLLVAKVEIEFQADFIQSTHPQVSTAFISETPLACIS